LFQDTPQQAKSLKYDFIAYSESTEVLKYFASCFTEIQQLLTKPHYFE